MNDCEIEILRTNGALLHSHTFQDKKEAVKWLNGSGYVSAELKYLCFIRINVDGHRLTEEERCAQGFPI